jgi:hypothetical protein
MDPEAHVPALIFGPGLPSAGARGTVRVSAIGAEAAAGDVSLRAPLADVGLRSVGFDERGLELSWNSGDAAWAVNAFALPGGVIVVNTGLIAATSRPEELAGVLAHEVQHVELRHSIRGMVKDLGLRGLFAFATGDRGGSLLGEAAVGLASLKFSRDDESQADQAAFDTLIAAEIDPSGLPAFFEIMHKQGQHAPAAFVSTHPLSADREAALRARLSTGTKVYTPLRFDRWPPR